MEEARIVTFSLSKAFRHDNIRGTERHVLVLAGEIFREGSFPTFEAKGSIAPHPTIDFEGNWHQP